MGYGRREDMQVIHAHPDINGTDFGGMLLFFVKVR